MAEQAIEQSGAGRPEYAPSDKDKGAVQALSAAGYPQAQIADYLDIDEKTLRKHFRRELDFATMELIGTGVGKLAEAVKNGEPWAVCFLLKTKGKSLGWTERVEVTGNDGGPVEVADATTRLADLIARRSAASRNTQGAEQPQSA